MPDTAPLHHCHAEGCRVPIEPGLLLCRRHFLDLPPALRGALAEHHQRGGWLDEPPRPEYALASLEARIWLAEHEGREIPGYLLSRRRILLRERERPRDPQAPGLFDAVPEAEEGPLAEEPAPVLHPAPQPQLFQTPPRPLSLPAAAPLPVSAEDAGRHPSLAALLAALRLGPPGWPQAAEGLGADDARRVASLARLTREEAERAGGSAKAPPRGAELLAVLGRLVSGPALERVSLARGPREAPESAVLRAWRAARRSLLAGVPAIAVVEPIAAEAPPRGGTPRWVAHAPRAWLIVHVPDAMEPADLAFPLRALDPLAPGWQTLLCHHVAARPFAAPVGQGAARRWAQGSPLPVLAGPWVEGPVGELAPHRRALLALSELVVAI